MGQYTAIPSSGPPLIAVPDNLPYYHGTRNAPFQKFRARSSLTPALWRARAFAEGAAGLHPPRGKSGARVVETRVGVPGGQAPQIDAKPGLADRIFDPETSQSESQRLLKNYHREAAAAARRGGYKAYFVGGGINESPNGELVILDPDAVRIYDQNILPSMLPHRDYSSPTGPDHDKSRAEEEGRAVAGKSISFNDLPNSGMPPRQNSPPSPEREELRQRIRDLNQRIQSFPSSTDTNQQRQAARQRRQTIKQYEATRVPRRAAEPAVTAPRRGRGGHDFKLARRR